MMVKKQLRKETLYLLGLLLCSLSIYTFIPLEALPAMAQNKTWHYSIDTQLGIISGCENNDSFVGELLLKAQNSHESFKDVAYENKRYINRTSETKSACYIETRTTDYVEFLCMEFPPQAELSQSTQHVIHFNKTECWQGRDLFFFSNISRLIESNSLEAFQKRLSHFFTL